MRLLRYWSSLRCFCFPVSISHAAVLLPAGCLRGGMLSCFRGQGRPSRYLLSSPGLDTLPKHLFRDCTVPGAGSLRRSASAILRCPKRIAQPSALQIASTSSAVNPELERQSPSPDITYATLQVEKLSPRPTQMCTAQHAPFNAQ